jgi:hypothetical protein
MVCLMSWSPADGVPARFGSDNQTLIPVSGTGVDQCDVPFLTPIPMNPMDTYYHPSDPQAAPTDDYINPQSVPLPMSHFWSDNGWCSSEFPPAPPITQPCLVPPIYISTYDIPFLLRHERHHLPDRPHPYVPGRTRSEFTESRSGPPAASSASPLKPTVASDAVKRSSMKRRKTEAKFVCETCWADFTAKHNLKSRYLTSDNVHLC